MAHLFISYASDDQPVAMEVCALLEMRGVSCWIAPRDVAPGAKWDEAIVDAIHGSAAFLLILTHAANESPYVSNEVNQAFAAQKPIFTFRVEDVQPNKSLGFYLGRHHWTDGFPRPLDDKVDRLAAAVAVLPGVIDAGAGSVATAAPRTVRRATRRLRIPWRAIAIGVGCAAAGAAGAIALVTLRAPSVAPPAVVRFGVSPPSGNAFFSGGAQTFQWTMALSPDGARLAFVAGSQGHAQIWVRTLENDTARALTPATNYPGQMFWSPDARSIGFFDANMLQTVDVATGNVQVLADLGARATVVYGATWGRNGDILFSLFAPGGFAQLFHLPQGAHMATPLFDTSKESRGQFWPSFLPDGDHFLFVDSPATRSQSAVMVGSLRTPERTVVTTADSSAFYSSGYLLFHRDSTVMAQRFDFDRLTVSGDAVPVAQDVQYSANTLGASVTASGNGVLAWLPGGSIAPSYRMVWVDRKGTEQPVTAPPRPYYAPRISPDGRRVVVALGEIPETQIWLYDLGRDTLSRLTFEGTGNIGPVWSADGTRVVYKGAGNNIFWQPADGSGAPELLTKTPLSRNNVPSSFTADGRLLLFTQDTTERLPWVLPMDSRVPQIWVKPATHPAYETAPRFSPDGKWIAYDSRESGGDEIFVRPYPGPGGKWQISTQGGTEVVWNPNGRELFYRSAGAMMAVDVTTQPTFSAGKPRQLFEAPYVLSPLSSPDYDVSPDGQRFLMLKRPDREASPPQITVVVNWPEALRATAK